MTIQDAIEQLRNYQGPEKLTLHPGADDATLQAVERIYNITLPDDFKEFYRFTDGCEIDEDIFNMIPLKDIIEDKGKDSKAPFYIAEYMIYSDMWQLEINRDNSNDYKILIYSLTTKVVLTTSLAEFISRFLKGSVFGPGGLHEWQQEVELQPIYTTKLTTAATRPIQRRKKGNLLYVFKVALALAVILTVGVLLAINRYSLSFLALCFMMRSGYDWWVARKK